MVEKHARQRYYVSREVQISIALIVLWSFLAVGLIMFLAKEFGDSLGRHGIVTFIAILLGYLFVVIILTWFFSRRLIGPFPRLNAEIDRIIAGSLAKRLQVRRKDDLAIRMFVNHVNTLIDELEENRNCSLRHLGRVRTELSGILARFEQREVSGEQLGELLASLHQTVSGLVKEQRGRSQATPEHQGKAGPHTP